MNKVKEVKKRLRICKHCKADPVVNIRNGHLDIWCSSTDRVCYPGAWAEGTDFEAVINEWNSIHGE